MDKQQPDVVVTYVDADLYFYSDPSAVLDEMGNGSIFIHEHDFAPEHAHMVSISGRFNVGLSAFRNNDEGRACLATWRRQCIGECVMDPAAGKCGDQNYLDNWPDLYPGLVISTNPGIGIGPWNVSGRRVERAPGGVLANGEPVIFYHFHSLRILRPRFGVLPIAMTFGNYLVDDHVAREIYRPYGKALSSALKAICKCSESKRLGHSFLDELPTLPQRYSEIRRQQLMFSAAGLSVPIAYNAKLLEVLYGIDAKREML
jgi:hypothetical protein